MTSIRVYLVLLALTVHAVAGAGTSNQLNTLFLSQAKESASLKNLATAIPDRLLSLGIYNLGTTDVKNLKTKIERTTFRENSSFVPTISGSRTSAYYEPTTKTLVVNTTASPLVGYAIHSSSASTDALALRLERAEPLLLHEVLGANGIDDSKYNKSIGAYLLTKSQNPPLADAIQKYLVVAGGTTAVGGGGNDISQWIKLKLVELALSRSNADYCGGFDSIGLVIRLLDLNIEGSFTCDHLSLEYNRSLNTIQHCQSSAWWDLNAGEDQMASIKYFLERYCSIADQGH